jgi:CheY-like chemotaxis protein
MRDKTFLLVEDDPNDAYLVELEFQKMPHQRLRWVKDGQEAINYVEGKLPYSDRTAFPMPDIIILDLKMPGIGGFEFLEWIHRDAPNGLSLIPVIVMSGSDLEQDVKRAYKMGANFYMTKPADWKQFRERMALLGVLWGEHGETPIVSRR